jgi:hypothetical protein
VPPAGSKAITNTKSQPPLPWYKSLCNDCLPIYKKIQNTKIYEAWMSWMSICCSFLARYNTTTCGVSLGGTSYWISKQRIFLFQGFILSRDRSERWIFGYPDLSRMVILFLEYTIFSVQKASKKTVFDSFFEHINVFKWHSNFSRMVILNLSFFF